MSNQQQHSPLSNPLLEMRRFRADGTEYWSARELMAWFQYTSWQKFMTPIRRAMKSRQAVGGNAQASFIEIREATVGCPRQNYELDRTAAYLVVMNCDGTKPHVSAVQNYITQTVAAMDSTPAMNNPGLAGDHNE